jgi:hypothetical protein
MAWRKRNSDKDNRRLLLEESRATGLLNFILAVSVAAIAYTDWIVVENDSLGYLYVLPIALSGLVNRLPITVGLSLLCAYLQDLFGPPEDTVHVRIVRAFISLSGYLIIGFLVTAVARQRAALAAEIRKERDDYEKDLTLAAQVQRRVLPTPPVIPGIQLAAAMQTARLLGGDYYDFFPISDDTVDVVIADVSGKGAAASLLMPSLAVALRLRARELSGPAAIIKDLDTILYQITNPATFVTVFYARINPTPAPSNTPAEATIRLFSSAHAPAKPFSSTPRVPSSASCPAPSSPTPSSLSRPATSSPSTPTESPNRKTKYPSSSPSTASNKSSSPTKTTPPPPSLPASPKLSPLSPAPPNRKTTSP